MSLRPLGDRIIVRPITKKLSSIIEIPANGEPTMLGEVVARGPEVGDYLREGTRVYHSLHGLQTFEHEGEELASLSQNSVLFAVDDFNCMDDS